LAGATREVTASSFFAAASGFAVSSAQSAGTNKKASAVVAMIRVANLIVVS